MASFGCAGNHIMINTLHLRLPHAVTFELVNACCCESLPDMNDLDGVASYSVFTGYALQCVRC